jgi:hypothetical protein
MDISSAIRIRNPDASKQVIFVPFEGNVDLEKVIALAERLNPLGFCLDIAIKTEIYKARHADFHSLYNNGLSIYEGAF